MPRQNQSLLVVLIGLPGAGKSTLAHALCRAERLARVDRDALRWQQGAGPLMTKAAANRAVWRRARGLLAQGRSVVLDGMTFGDARQRRHARAVARRHGARCVELWLDCPAAIARERIRNGGAHVARDRDPQLVDQVARRFARVPRHVTRLDARRSPRALLRQARAALPRPSAATS